MTSFRITQLGIQIQDGIRQMISESTYTHLVTLNFHAEYRQETGKKRLKLWAKNALCRLFRASAYKTEATNDLFRFIAIPEYTKSGHLHFHLLLYIDSSQLNAFPQVAAKIWKKIVPTGTTYVQALGCTDNDKSSAAHYITKHSNRSFSHDEFITSNMLDLAHYLPAVAKAKIEPRRKNAADKHA